MKMPTAFKFTLIGTCEGCIPYTGLRRRVMIPTRGRDCVVIGRLNTLKSTELA